MGSNSAILTALKSFFQPFFYYYILSLKWLYKFQPGKFNHKMQERLTNIISKLRHSMAKRFRKKNIFGVTKWISRILRAIYVQGCQGDIPLKLKTEWDCVSHILRERESEKWREGGEREDIQYSINLKNGTLLRLLEGLQKVRQCWHILISAQRKGNVPKEILKPKPSVFGFITNYV